MKSHFSDFSHRAYHYELAIVRLGLRSQEMVSELATQLMGCDFQSATFTRKSLEGVATLAWNGAPLIIHDIGPVSELFCQCVSGEKKMRQRRRGT